MKKFISLILSILLVFACVGCGGGSSESSSSKRSRPTTSSQSSLSEISSSLQESSSSEIESSSVISSSSQPSSSSSSSSLSSSSSSSSSSTPTIEGESPLAYTDISLDNLTTAQQEEIDRLFYQNNTETVSADPACIYVEEEGYFYLYGTSGKKINCFRSTNLSDWEAMPDAFKQAIDMTYSEVSDIMTEQEFASYQENSWIKYGNTWAPSILYDEASGLYMMFFSAQLAKADTENNISAKYSMVLATSTSPAGPFIQWKGTISAGEYQNGQSYSAYEIGYEDTFIDFLRSEAVNAPYPYEGHFDAIDIEPFIDPKTGDKYIYFVRATGDNHDTNSIMGMKMIDWYTPDYSTLTLLAVPNYAKVSDLTKTLSDENYINEGPYVVYNEENGLYYMTYSAKEYTNKLYMVKQAVATSPLGEFEKISANKGGRVIACETDWLHRGGTGHHVFVKAGNELFIVYHMHIDPIKVHATWKPRCIAIDKMSWTENQDGLLVMNAGGPSYDYRMRPQVVTGYSNLASEATISVNQQKQGAKFQYLTDGAVQMHVSEGISEFEANNAPLEITLNFADPITLKGVMVTNSWSLYTAFDKISKIEVEYLSGGKAYRVYTGEVTFDWDKCYNDNVDSAGFSLYIPGCSSTAIFDEISSVYKVKIYIAHQPYDDMNGLSVSDIAIIGK